MSESNTLPRVQMESINLPVGKALVRVAQRPAVRYNSMFRGGLTTLFLTGEVQLAVAVTSSILKCTIK